MNSPNMWFRDTYNQVSVGEIIDYVDSRQSQAGSAQSIHEGAMQRRLRRDKRN